MFSLMWLSHLVFLYTDVFFGVLFSHTIYIHLLFPIKKKINLVVLSNM